MTGHPRPRVARFEVESGETLDLLGPNGSGKTTTVELRRLVGSQLQDSALPDRLRVGEALELFANLSGGQRQRLFVALAPVFDPRLVVLDEMTTGLDPAARRVAWIRQRDRVPADAEPDHPDGAGTSRMMVRRQPRRPPPSPVRRGFRPCHGNVDRPSV